MMPKRAPIRIVRTPLAACAVAGLFVVFAATRSIEKADAQSTVQDVTLDAATRVIEAALDKAEELDVEMNVAIVDAGGNLKAFVRMDGAFLGSIDVAMRKAKTSRMFDAPTGALKDATAPGGPLYGLERTNGGLITFAGGLPLHNAAGEVVGAIGVSGSSVENDLAVAQAGAQAF